MNEPGTGKVSAAENIIYGSIPREDVASTIIAALKEENTFSKTFDLITGEVSIVNALQPI
ncbi:putative sugar epimerase YhfK [compost metagenome]